MPIGAPAPSANNLQDLVSMVPDSRREKVASFISALFKVYEELHFSYLEINPLVFVNGQVTGLDLAAKIDETAAFLCSDKWGDLDFPVPFGRPMTAEEEYIRELDAKTGLPQAFRSKSFEAEFGPWSLVAYRSCMLIQSRSWIWARASQLWRIFWSTVRGRPTSMPRLS